MIENESAIEKKRSSIDSVLYSNKRTWHNESANILKGRKETGNSGSNISLRQLTRLIQER